MALEISVRKGDEYYFDDRVLSVGDHWMTGVWGGKNLAAMTKEASLIAIVLDPQTVDQQLAVAVLHGDKAAAVALVDKVRMEDG